MAYSSDSDDDIDNDSVRDQNTSTMKQYSSSEEEDSDNDDNINDNPNENNNEDDIDSDDEDDNEEGEDDGGESQQSSFMVDQSFDSYAMNQSFQTTDNNDNDDDSDEDDDDDDNGNHDDNNNDDDDLSDEDENANNLSSYSSTYMTGNRMSLASNASTFASGLDTSMQSMQDTSMLDDGDEDDDDDSADDDDDDNDEGKNRNGNDNSDDDGEDGDDNGISANQAPTSIAAAASGKVLIRPSNSESDEDDEDDDEGEASVNVPTGDQGGNDTSSNNGHSSNQQHQQLSGKPLSMMAAAADDDDESSSDDELLVSHKSKTARKSTSAKKSVKKKKVSTKASNKSSNKISIKASKKASTKVPTKRKKKRSSATTAVATADDDDDDAIEAVAVLDDAGDANSDSDTVEAVIEAVVIPQEPPKKKRKKPGPKPKKRPKEDKKSSSKSSRGGGDKRSSKGKKRRVNDSDSEGSCYAATIIPHERLKAAEQARDILVNSVQRTPFVMSESHTVRNFGRIKIEEGTSSLDTLYSSATILYPVGYSCDRYEFSPVHGRFLKLRCDILDGKNKEKLSTQSSSEHEKDSLNESTNVNQKDGEKKKDLNNGSKSKAGPIFRIMWGRGIDEIDDAQSFPFDLYSSSTPLGNEVDAVAVPVGKDTVKIKPEQGMRVKVRFDNDICYHGSILQVSEKNEPSVPKKKASARGGIGKKEKKQQFDVQILYDDGIKEDVTFPDPDIHLVPPAADDMDVGCSTTAKLVNGKPVTTVTGSSPIEAWAQALIKLGLIDEIIYEQALRSISDARCEGLADLKGKNESTRRHRHEFKPRQKEKNDRSSTGESMTIDKAEKSTKSDRELQLRKRVGDLLERYETRLSESRSAATELADARIQVFGPFLSNPFLDSDASLNQQKQWLSTIIKKEKAKIGSTGNKRKIVTATGLLERTSTFYNVDIERLIEGLPGSEFCPSYVFHSLRGSGASALTWMHEEQIRQEREKEKRNRRILESKLEAELIREKELKRKAREDEREVRKKQKLDEIDQVKREREQTRLTRLSTQIDEKLFKESCIQRERVTFLATKLVGKEVSRRRKAAEIMVAHLVGNTAESSSSNDDIYNDPLPISKRYSTDVLKIWNFMKTYEGAFNCKDKTRFVPELDELQDAINILADLNSERSSRKKAIELLTSIAIALCVPMNKGLIKTLSSVLTTALQDNKGEKDEDDSNSAASAENDPDSFPINIFTWKEFARLILLTDALNELGYTKIEQTHILRGHRTGGHPNSKEAKRVKRGEDYALVLRRQTLSEIDSKTAMKAMGIKISIPTPCQPSALPRDWIYFLHNIKSLPSNAATSMKSNLKKACTLLKSTKAETFKGKKMDKNATTIELQRNLSMLDEIGTSITSSSETINLCKKVRQNILKLLDSSTGEIYSVMKASKAVHRNSDTECKEKNISNDDCATLRKNTRQKAGLYRKLKLTDEAYKEFTITKEEYMTAAIALIEDQERKKKRAEGGNDDEEDDDDDDDDEEEGKKGDNDESNKEGETNNEDEGRIGKKTEFDDFCADEPKAPELIRRCLAVLRSLCLTLPAESFIYPVDPRTNIKYYDAVIKPMSLYDIGKVLQQEAKRLRGKQDNEADIDRAVAQFGRNVRLIGQNCTIFSTVGAAIISTAEEMVRIFERLFFDWVLSPEDILRPLDALDDDRCVVFHASDEDAMVLLCDGCEGKFNMSRLDPPLKSVPKGDWYCPRCRTGYCWASVDTRIGRKVLRTAAAQQSNAADTSEQDKGVIVACMTTFADDDTGRATLTYTVRFGNGHEENWSLKKVDEILSKTGDDMPKIRCEEAIAESPGYGCGIENGLTLEAVPVPINPTISDAAAQQALTSSVFRETVVASGVLLVNDIDAISSGEWVQILILLLMKCATTDKIQEYSNKIESEAHIEANSTISKEAKVKSINDVIPKVTDNDEDECENENKDGNNDEGENKDGKKNENGDRKKNENKDDDGKKNEDENKDGNETNVQKSIKSENENPIEEKNASDASGLTNDTQEKIPNEEEILAKQRRKEVLLAMKERQKARESSMLANYIKAQIRPAISSFEEDNITQVITSYLSPNNMEGVNFVSSRCRSLKCDLCGLSDMALATPLVRTPNHQEWLERMSFACSGRKSFLVADIGAPTNENDSSGEVSTEVPLKDSIETPDTTVADTISSSGLVKASISPKKRKSKFASVTVRVGGEIISIKESGVDSCDDGLGIVSFLPRNEQGFQSELENRYKDGLPFVTGSLSAHDCCALVAHKARMEKVIQDDKEKTASIIERNFGNTCGRTISLGNDETGRWYWKFDLEPDSLFISGGDETEHGVIHRFSSPETIASVIKSLGKNSLVNAIQKAYPKALAVINDGTWSNSLQRRSFEHVFDRLDDTQDDKQAEGSEKEEDSDSEIVDPYEEGEEVLIESSSGKLLWDARIIAVSKSIDDKVTGYRVHYTEWSSRFDEWVKPNRVVEANDNNILVQKELSDAMSSQKKTAPLELHELHAASFLDSPNRSRLSSPIINFSDISNYVPSNPTDDHRLGLLRCATLMIEAALPAGAVDTSPSGYWRAEKSAYWRSMVMNAKSPRSLMGCIILFEHVLSSDWLRPNAEHLLGCLSRPWKAINDASVSSIALRLWVLDRGIKYGLSHDEDGEWRTLDEEEEEEEEEEDD